MRDEQVRNRVREIVGEMSPLENRNPNTTDRLVEELGYDSLSLIELALALESEFDLPEIEEEEAIDVVTVGDVEELVTKVVTVEEPQT